jgi:TonB family protein
MQLRTTLALVTCLLFPAIAQADEHPPATPGRPAKIGVMSPAAQSELDACVNQAVQSAGDAQQRRVIMGVFIGSKGRAASVAILESSGLDPLDQLVLRCLSRAEYTPPAPGKATVQWFFRASLQPKRPRPASAGAG